MEALSQGPPVLRQLAFELSQQGAQFSPELRWRCAVRSRRFREALQILKDQHLRTPEYPLMPHSSPLFRSFQELASHCIRCTPLPSCTFLYFTVLHCTSLYGF